MTIRVFLVDDQMLVRTGFQMLIDAQPDMTVVGEASDGSAAVAQLGPGGRLRAGTDVVLMDVRMPVMNGVRATELITGDDAAVPSPVDHQRPDLAAGPSTSAKADAGTADPGTAIGPKVLVLTTFDLDEYVFAALRAGASGFLLKDARPEELLGAIRAVAAGDAVVAPSATRRLLDHVIGVLPGGAAGPPDARLALITARERQVLLEVAGGATNAEIAARLFLAEATVKTHIGRLLAKLERRDRVGLVVFAYENGLVSAG